MAVYYIDFVNGNDENDGLSAENARKSYQNIDAQAGDSILFKRGSFVRNKLNAISGVHYGAYGEGEMPTFCGSTDVSDKADWAETNRKNVWKCVKEMHGDVGNMVYDGECTATLRWELDELCAQGDFYDERCHIGDRAELKTDGLGLYVYSEGNPACVYSHIEAISYNTRQLVVLKDGMSFEGLRFINSGVHAMAGQGNNITVRNCVFENIGGCVWNKGVVVIFVLMRRRRR